MRRFASGTAIAATVLALALIVRCHPAAAAESAPPVIAEAANPLLNPPVSDGYRLQVAIALRVINIAGIDEVAQRFNLVGYLVAHWKDPRLAFTPRGPWEKFRTYTRSALVPAFRFRQWRRAALGL